MASAKPPQEWTLTSPSNQTFQISTSRKLLSSSFINSAFASDEMFWAKPLSPELLEQALDASTTLGLYDVTPQIDGDPNEASGEAVTRKQIGLARLITDHTTFAWLTDVYILPSYRGGGLGLGTWMIRCCREVVEGMGALRWMLLFTGSERAKALYEREFAMKEVVGDEGLKVMGVRGQNFLKKEVTETDESKK